MAAVARDIFDRLNAGRLSPTEEATKLQLRKGNPKTRLKIILMDVLASGPAPTTIVLERGQAHGFTRKQLWAAREKMKIVAFKETGKTYGRWFLALPQHAG